ncbi:MAG: hypothetical protein J6W35_07450 [Eubacterium sp.]|nr:hypothetical protein [Eubacterium sp.]
MKEHIKYFNKYSSPIWCYVMIWAVMDRWGEDFFDQTCHFYDRYYEDFIRFMWGRGEIDEFVAEALLSKSDNPDFVEIEWILTKDLDCSRRKSVEDKVYFKIYQLFAKFVSLNEDIAEIIESIINNVDIWDARDNDEYVSQVISLMNNALDYEEYEEMSLMDIIYGTRRGEI